jgi:hypothetical protein
LTLPDIPPNTRTPTHRYILFPSLSQSYISLFAFNEKVWLVCPCSSKISLLSLRETGYYDDLIDPHTKVTFWITIVLSKIQFQPCLSPLFSRESKNAYLFLLLAHREQVQLNGWQWVLTAYSLVPVI